MLSHTSVPREAVLEEQEIRLGEQRVLQHFATEAASEDLNSPLVSGLDLVVNGGKRQDGPFATPWRNFYDGSVYVYVLDCEIPLPR